MHRPSSIRLAIALALVMAAAGCTSILGGLTVGDDGAGTDATTEGGPGDEAGADSVSPEGQGPDGTSGDAAPDDVAVQDSTTDSSPGTDTGTDTGTGATTDTGADAPALCGAATCQNGCCKGGPTGTCVAWAQQTGSECGTSGAACAGCVEGLCDTTTGTCACDAVSCSGGCCNGGSAGACVAYASQSNTSCGASGSPCAGCGAQVCKGSGGCVACTANSQCTAPNDACCAGGCTITSTDPNNCGSCGNLCSGGKTCQSSVCACPAGTTTCSGTCVDLQTDGAACGSCSRNCLGGACKAGVCQPITLVSFPTSGIQFQFAVDSQNLYWVQPDPTTGGIYSCPLSGCTTPTTIASGLNQPYSLAIDSQNVYFGEQPASIVGQVPKIGGLVSTFSNVPTTSYPWGIAILGSHLFVAENGNGTTAQLTVPGGTSPVTLSSSSGNPYAPYAAGSYVFWSNLSTPTAVFRAPIGSAGSGTPYVTLASTTPYAVFADTSNVYWTDSGNNVATCPASLATSCTSITTLATNQAGVWGLGGLAVDSSQTVYWAGYVNSTGVYVRRCAAAGCSAPFEVSSYSSTSMNYLADGIAVDSTFVYWGVWDNGQEYIFKSAK